MSTKQTKRGLIMRSTGLWYELKEEETGKIRIGRLKGKMKLKGYKLTNPLACGDWVFFEEENEAENTVVITEIDERKNYLLRTSPHRNRQAHMIAANLDCAYLLVTLVQPRTSTGFIDRFLIVAESYGIPAALVFNKCDLLDEDGLSVLEEFMNIYQSIGYPCYQVSALEKEGMDPLLDSLKGKISLFTGHSGVGKSTLLNALAPEITQKTQEVSNATGKGLHTTTFAEMFELENETYIIDTPGIRELGLYEINEGELGLFFVDFHAFREKCKYYNCRHLSEPQCAVRDAVEAGEIAESRYHSYCSMISNQDNRG